MRVSALALQIPIRLSGEVDPELGWASVRNIIRFCLPVPASLARPSKSLAPPLMPSSMSVPPRGCNLNSFSLKAATSKVFIDASSCTTSTLVSNATRPNESSGVRWSMSATTQSLATSSMFLASPLRKGLLMDPEMSSTSTRLRRGRPYLRMPSPSRRPRKPHPTQYSTSPLRGSGETAVNHWHEKGFSVSLPTAKKCSLNIPSWVMLDSDGSWPLESTTLKFPISCAPAAPAQEERER